MTNTEITTRIRQLTIFWQECEERGQIRRANEILATIEALRASMD